jgi:hypothetical protein
MRKEKSKTIIWTLLFILISLSEILLLRSNFYQRNLIERQKKEINEFNKNHTNDSSSFCFNTLGAEVYPKSYFFKKLYDTIEIHPFLKVENLPLKGETKLSFILTYEYNEKGTEFIFIDSIGYNGFNTLKICPSKGGKHYQFGTIFYPSNGGKYEAFNFIFPYFGKNCYKNNEYSPEVKKINELFTDFEEFAKNKENMLNLFHHL